MGEAAAIEESALGRVMREQGRTKKWLAQQLGVGYFRVWELCRGTKELRISEAARAAEVLGVPLETFIPPAEVA